jgi:MerR family transcriptional regulator, light-induced transcriptional regulator
MNRHKQPPFLMRESVDGPSFRSGAVARMAQMPVATLRIWEQRYQAVQPTTAPSGHRLYSTADVQRVRLLRELTQRGNAISAMAGLETAQLHELVQQSGDTVPLPGSKAVRSTAALRLVVVGHALAARLQRPIVTQGLSKPAKLLAVFESLAEAAQAASEGSMCDLLIWQLPALQAEVSPELLAAQEAWRASQLAVVYRFAGTAAKAAFAHTGALLVREPPDDEDLGAWLGSLEDTLAANAAEPVGHTKPLNFAELEVGSPVVPRRFDDATLTAIAGLSPTLACECPRHVAELLMQLCSFEAYSAGCMSHNPNDTELHAYLQRIAGASRALFETALENVARHESLHLG